MAVNLTLTTGFAAVAGLGARASPARRALPAHTRLNVVVGGANKKSSFGKSIAISTHGRSSSSIVAMTAVRRRATSVVRAAADSDAPNPEEEEEEELDTELLVKELMDTSQLGGRGEVFFFGQMLLLVLLAFPPGGGSLDGIESVQKDAFDPVIGLALLALSGVLVVKVRKPHNCLTQQFLERFFTVSHLFLSVRTSINVVTL
jgi:hypothetical protein